MMRMHTYLGSCYTWHIDSRCTHVVPCSQASVEPNLTPDLPSSLLLLSVYNSGSKWICGHTVGIELGGGSGLGSDQ